ncbi:hypothetical protein Mterra_03789 [Calidithermus terrae]|uniref:Uncharacterized protein n=1 Tax=Calidithermus terrae TaxID=1408545 RepID=A0A399DZH6_9DEIN|nr:hypothetical protein Mterra_03789 [Calidithermus terrae]
MEAGTTPQTSKAVLQRVVEHWGAEAWSREHGPDE